VRGPDAAIVEAVQRSVGSAPVVLCGSRANGTAEAGSDYDVAVVLPWRAIPKATPRLGREARRLRRDLGVEVSLNPVPRWVAERPHRHLFVWKMHRDGRALTPGFPLTPPPAFPLTAGAEFSYQMTALMYLVQDFDPADLAEPRLRAVVARGVAKAVLHLSQLKLLRTGTYAADLDAAAAQAGDRGLRAITQRIETPAGWLGARDALRRELGDRPPSCPPSRAVVRNVQYAVLARLRGERRWRTALSTLVALDRRFAVAGVRLLDAVQPSGGFHPPGLEAAREALPARLRPMSAGWNGLRDVVVHEWRQAHPLLGI